MAPSDILRPIVLESMHRSKAFRGFAGLAVALREADEDGDGKITPAAFEEALSDAGVRSLAPTDVAALAEQFGDDGGSVYWLECLEALQGEPTRSRVVQMRAVFDMLDEDGDGVVSLCDAKASFRPSGHPDVRVGAVKASDLEAWVNELLLQAAGGGMDISASAWEVFQTLFTQHLDDVKFVEVMAAVWRPPGERRDGVTSKRTNLRTGAVGVMEQLRKRLAAAGTRAFLTLGTSLRQKASRQGTITLQGFEAALAEAGAEMDAVATKQLFRHFDHDGIGSISAREALIGIRGALVHNRAALVRQAFTALDLHADGLLLPATVAARFNPSGHPDARGGADQKAEERVRTEFLEGFQAGGVVPGRVTASEWEEYHAALSATIDSDARFESIMRGLWSLPARTSTAHQTQQLPNGLARSGISWDDHGRAAGQSSVREAIHGSGARHPSNHKGHIVNSDGTAAAAGALSPKERAQARSTSAKGGQALIGRHAASPNRAGLPRTSPFWVDEVLLSPAQQQQMQQQAQQQQQRALETPRQSGPAGGPNAVSPARSSFGAEKQQDQPMPTTRFGSSARARAQRTSPFAVVESMPPPPPPSEAGATTLQAQLTNTPPRPTSAAGVSTSSAVPLSPPVRVRAAIASSPSGAPLSSGLHLHSARQTVAAAKRQADAHKAKEEGAAYTLAGFKAEMRRHGPMAAALLKRALREADAGARGVLALAPFRKGVRRAGLELSDKDVRRVFEHLDESTCGTVRIADVMSRLREPLSQRRKAAITAAWAALDPNNAGSVTPQRLIECFKAAAHPDAASGAKTAAETASEFFDAFEVGGTVEGRVTKADFADFYADLSPAYEQDDAFEALVRGPWGLANNNRQSSNPTAAAAGAVTRAKNGSVAASIAARSPPRQTVGRFTSQLGGGGSGGGGGNDVVRTSGNMGSVSSVDRALEEVGSKPRPKTFAELKEKCAAGGSAASSHARSEASLALRRRVLAEKSYSQISFGASGTGSNQLVNPADHVQQQQQQQQQLPAAVGIESGRRGSVDGRRHVQPLVDPFSSHLGQGFYVSSGGSPKAQHGAAASPAAAAALPLALLAAGRASSHQSRAEMSGSSLLKHLKQHLAKGGVTALAAFGRHLRAAAAACADAGDSTESSSATLSEPEFAEALQEHGGEQFSSPEVANALFRSHSTGKNNDQLDVESFLAKMVPALPPRRLALVRRAFRQLCLAVGDATPPATALLNAYDAAAHPQAVSGERTADELFCEFADSFDVTPAAESGGEDEESAGKVAASDFESYHALVSATVPGDEAFEKLVCGIWHVAPPPPEGFSPGDEAGPPLPLRSVRLQNSNNVKAALTSNAYEEATPGEGAAAPVSGSTPPPPPSGRFGAMQRARAKAASGGNSVAAGFSKGGKGGVAPGGVSVPRAGVSIETTDKLPFTPTRRASGGPTHAGNMSPTYRSNIQWG